MVQKPAFAFIGDMSGVLAQSVSSAVDLTPFSASAALAGAGLLVDGSQQSPAQEILAEVLDSGSVLAVVNPDAHVRTHLLALTGQAPADPLPLTTFRRAPAGQGFICGALPVPQDTAQTMVDGAGAHSARAIPAGPPDVAGELCRAALSQQPEDGDSWSIPGFVPPHLSTAGYACVRTPMTYGVPYPVLDGEADDGFMKTTAQQINTEILTEFFVFWVNGAGPLQPYFEVIVRQTGPAAIGIGPPPFNYELSRGWFQASLTLGPATFTNANDQPFTDGFSLSKHTPTTEDDDSLRLQLEVTMALYGTLPSGGSGTNNFTATYSSTPSFTAWRIADQTAGQTPLWAFVQAQPWDPVENPPPHIDLNAFYDSSGNVIAFPAQSFASLSFEALCAWQFVPPTSATQALSSSVVPSPPATYPVTFHSHASQLVALVHNQHGCLGASGEHLRHFFSSTQPQDAPSAHTLDLSQIALLENYPQQN